MRLTFYRVKLVRAGKMIRTNLGPNLGNTTPPTPVPAPGPTLGGILIEPGSPLGARNPGEARAFAELTGRVGARARRRLGPRAAAYLVYALDRGAERCAEVAGGELVEPRRTALPTISPRRDWAERGAALRRARVADFAASLRHDGGDADREVVRDFLRDAQVMVLGVFLSGSAKGGATGVSPALANVADRVADPGLVEWERLALLARVAREVVRSYGARGGLQFLSDTFATLDAEDSANRGPIE